MYTFPELSAATPTGARNIADVAAVPSRLVSVPATVTTLYVWPDTRDPATKQRVRRPFNPILK